MPADEKTRAISAFPKKEKDAFSQGKTYLLAIGINEYEHHRRLENAVEDAKSMVEVLTARYDFLPDHVCELTDRQATCDNILDQLAAYQQLAPEDNLLIYFSGHGFFKNKVGYLVPHDAKPVPSSRFLNNSHLFDELSQIPARHILLIADSCFSGSLFRDAAEPRLAVAGQVERIPSRMAFSAGNIELVADGLVGNNSPFTRELLKALRANAQAKLPVSHLFHQVRDMATYAKQQPLCGPIHRLTEHPGGEFVFYLKDTADAAFENAKASRRKQDLIAFLETSENLAQKKEIRQILREVEAEEAWRMVNKNSYAEVDEFLDDNPGSLFAAEARQLRAELKAKSDAARSQDLERQKKAAEDERQRREAEKRKEEEERERKRRRSLDPFFDLMVHVEGGSFDMGGNEYDSEKPIHRVTVKDFYLCKFPVTQAQWKLIMGDNPSHFKGDDLPVETVSWDDAQAFLKKLNERTSASGGYRLPTEAEWEFAARGGKKSKGYKFSGSNEIDEVAWYEKNSGKKTHPVGQKQANELGLFDLSGNVWEWCEDDWHNNYSGAPANGSAWVDAPERGDSRVLRGGCYLNSALYCRPATRGNYSPVHRRNYFGFRLALPFQAVG